jgi:Rrf2 family protein
LAKRLQGSSAHLAKILQRLTKSGIVKGLRGPRGGFLLSRAPADIFLISIFSAIEGEQNPAMCAFEDPVCGWDRCMFNGLIQAMDRQFLDYLNSTNLQSVSAGSGKNGPEIRGNQIVRKKTKTGLQFK